MISDSEDGVREQTTPTKKKPVNVPWNDSQDGCIDMLDMVICGLFVIF